MKAQTSLIESKRIRAIIYARVSTDDQADKGYSLPSQLDACRKYAERLGFSIVGTQYYDLNTGLEVVQKDGVWQFVESAKSAQLVEKGLGRQINSIPAFVEDCSGTIPITERPEGKKLAAMLKAHQADAVIVYQVDRLSRDIVDLLATVRTWLRANLEVHTCDIGKIESELDIVLVIKGWQGSDERKKIIERCSRGRNSKAKSGKVVGNGLPPFGYRYRDGQFVVVEEEAKIIRLIFTWYVHGDGNSKPLTIWQICCRLTELGMPTPSQIMGRRHNRKRENHIWSFPTVSNFLTNETYMGIWRYGKKIGSNGNGGHRLAGDQITVSVPQIIDRATWEAAQARREYNKRTSKRNRKHDYLLSGHVRCAVCNYSMTGQMRWRGGGNRFYRCGKYRFTGMENYLCGRKQVRADLLEEKVWGYLIELMTDGEKFHAALREAQEKEQADLAPKREQLEILEKQLVEDEKEAGSFADALVYAPDGAVRRAIQDKITLFERLYAERIKRHEELQAELNRQILTDENIAAADQFRDDVIVGLLNPTFEDKRRALELLRVKVEVNAVEKKAWVTCLIPAELRTIDLTTFQSD